MKKVINIFKDIAQASYYDEIISASFVSDEVKDLTANDDLEININSYGGEVFEAVAMANIIATCPANKTFNVLGICASAATMLFSATDKVNIYDGAMVMYHKPLTMAMGNANDFQKQITLLNKIENENILKALAIRTKKPTDELTTLLLNEWWLSSDEAIQNLGFIATKKAAIENTAKTKQENIYNNYINRKKALNSNVYNRYINLKNSLK